MEVPLYVCTKCTHRGEKRLVGHYYHYNEGSAREARRNFLSHARFLSHAPREWHLVPRQCVRI